MYNANRFYEEKYVGAPYNFVPFNDKLIPYSDEELPKQNDVSEDLYEGEIEYTVSAITPVFAGSGISDGEAESFYTDAYGRYAIPGSSMRGLIRTNAQILSLSGFMDDIDDYSLMFRAVANGPKKEKERYAAILGAKQISTEKDGNKQMFSVLMNVKAGYIKNEHGTYKIYGTVLDKLDDVHGRMNYYILSERAVIEGYQKSKKNGTRFDYPLLINNGRRNGLMSDVNSRFVKDVDKRGRVHYKADSNRSYEPYTLKCSYEVKGSTVIAVEEPGKLSHEGYAVSTGYFKGPKNEKKAIYIIPEGVFNRQGAIVPKEDVDAFKIDLKRRGTTLRNFGGIDKFDLPKENQAKPVFYITEGKHLYFGFTPRLRLFYDHTISDGIPSAQKKAGLDYAKAMFGYSSKELSYKSRVFFSDAVAEEGSAKPAKVDYVQGEPKPTSYLDYVTPGKNGEGKSYNEDRFELRGVKQYWLHKQPVGSNVPEGKQGAKFVTSFKPLSAGTRFTGKVRFRNLRKDELGLLLWSLKPEIDSLMNIGKAKSFGYGSIDISVDSVRILDRKKAYLSSSLSLDPFINADKDAFIAFYKETVKDMLGGKNITDEYSVKTFLGMKSGKNIPGEDTIRYMSLANREYQNRTAPLPDALDVINKKH